MKPRELAVPALVVAATALLLVGCLTVWVRRQALDTPYVESASRQMLEDQEIRSAVASYLVDELYRHVDVQEQVTRLLPARERGLAAPFVAALRGLAPRAAEEILSEPIVVDTWATAVGRAHRDFDVAVLGIVAYLGLVSLALTRLLRRRKAALTPIAPAHA